MSKKASSPRQKKRNERYIKRMIWFGRQYERLSFPVTVFILFSNRRFNPKYGMTPWRRLRLGMRIYRNTRNVQTGIAYKAHLAMAVKLLEIPPAIKGAVVECGCWKGGTTTNLSIICNIVGRDLIVYDSFEGLPKPEENDNMKAEVAGYFRGDFHIQQGLPAMG